MGRISISDKFYEDEVREGFYIPACVKQAWGAEIIVLNEIDRVCNELNIKYFADWGTFLGAIRHGGFIPWDDDFDIVMLRDDYIKFLSQGIERLPKGFEIYNLETREEHEQFLANVVNKARICFEPEHLKTFHGFPYIACVDIFVIDYMSNDEEKQKSMEHKAKKLLELSDKIRSNIISDEDIRTELARIESSTGIKINGSLKKEKIRQLLDVEVTKIFASFVSGKKEAKQIVQMMPWGLNGTKIMPAEYYKKSIDVPFEEGTIPVPYIYEAALRVHYGDYMKLYKNAGGHNYPYFEKSKQDLIAVLDFDIPEYKADIELAKKERVCNKDDSYKSIALLCLREMHVVLDSNDDLIQKCSMLQQLAIDLGTYMETVKGEGYDVVIRLEELCERVFVLSTTAESEAFDRIAAIDAYIGEIEGIVRRRKEILFLPFKAEYFDKLRWAYDEAVKDENTDVYVIALPYYYKDYNGSLRDIQYYPEKYPDDVIITHYDAYDYQIHNPDVIVTQNPYDSYNDAISLPPFFYSDKLVKLTDRLVYIPWFDTDEFTKDNEREYINLKYYSYMPGVINSDVVLVQSENMRNNYINKICELSGEDIREALINKIYSRYEGAITDILKGKELRISDETVKPNETACDSSDKKKMLIYYYDFSQIVKYRQQALAKIRSVFVLFNESSDSVNVRVIIGPLINEVLKEDEADLFGMLNELREQCGNNISFEETKDLREVAEYYAKSADAYYGDSGVIAHVFRNYGKPVMIQNYEI